MIKDWARKERKNRSQPGSLLLVWLCVLDAIDWRKEAATCEGRVPQVDPIHSYFYVTGLDKHALVIACIFFLNSPDFWNKMVKTELKLSLNFPSIHVFIWFSSPKWTILFRKEQSRLINWIFFKRTKVHFLQSERKHCQIHCVTTVNVGLYNFWDSYIVYYQGL